MKVKQSHYRPRQAQRVPRSYDSQISLLRHRMVVGCQPYSPATFSPRKYSWYSYLLEAESTPEPYCDRKDFMSKKNPLTPAGIEPGTFRFVAQHLNHCATAAALIIQFYSISRRDLKFIKISTTYWYLDIIIKH